jgi:hypothetical protein
MAKSNPLTFTVVKGYNLYVDSKALEDGRVYLISVYVYLDDVYIGSTPLTWVTYGVHKLYVSSEPPYTFQYWGDGVVSNPRTINVASDTSLTAYFKYVSQGLFVDARDNYGLRVPVEVYIDDKYVGDVPVTVEVQGTHKLYAKCKMPWLYTWWRWSDGVMENPRSINVSGFMTVTAYYIYLGGAM